MKTKTKSKPGRVGRQRPATPSDTQRRIGYAAAVGMAVECTAALEHALTRFVELVQDPKTRRAVFDVLSASKGNELELVRMTVDAGAKTYVLDRLRAIKRPAKAPPARSKRS
jgi:hypothetical protein